MILFLRGSLFFLFFKLSILHAQVKIKNLFFNSPTNITEINFTGSTPAISYTNKGSGVGMGDSEGIAHAEDHDGNIIIWVNANHVYDRNGNLMPGSVGILANPSSTEIEICPFPNDSNRFYIIYNSQLCSNLYFSIVNMNLRGGLGDVEVLNTKVDSPNNYAEGLEIIKIPCSRNYWLLSYQCEVGFTRFIIDENGIHSPTLLYSYSTNNHNGRGELDYYNGRMGYAVTFRNKALFGEFNSSTGSFANPIEVSFLATNGMYGLEFSPDASKVYLTDWDNRDFLGNFVGSNLFRYDFTSGLVTSYSITNNGSQCGSTDVRGLGQIELAEDGNLYIPHMGGCQITIIKKADSLNPSLNLINVNSILSSGVSDPVQLDYVEKLKTSHDAVICLGDSILLTASGGNNFQWSPTNFLSTPDQSSTYASPVTDIQYKVMSENKFGCYESSFVHIKVNMPPLVTLGPDITVCENTPTLLNANTKADAYLWSDGSQYPSIRVSKAGTYWLKITNNNCHGYDTIVVHTISTKDVVIPNFISPNSDSKNDAFEINYSIGTLKLIIYNRWGKEVFSSEAYDNSWNAENLDEGIYYYKVEDNLGCLNNAKGWIHVIR